MMCLIRLAHWNLSVHMSCVGVRIWQTITAFPSVLILWPYLRWLFTATHVGSINALQCCTGHSRSPTMVPISHSKAKSSSSSSSRTPASRSSINAWTSSAIDGLSCTAPLEPVTSLLLETKQNKLSLLLGSQSDRTYAKNSKPGDSNGTLEEHSGSTGVRYSTEFGVVI